MSRFSPWSPKRVRRKASSPRNAPANSRKVPVPTFMSHTRFGTFRRLVVWYLQGMIVGIGVDIEEVERIRGAIERHGERFVRRVFTPGEVAYAEDKAHPFSSYAARFAAKEAAMKALGTGWDHGVRWRDIEVANEPGGRPRLSLRGRAAEVAEELGCRSIHLSLSHTRETALAEVILEG